MTILPRVALDQVADGGSDVAEGIGAVDDWPDLARLDELTKGHQVVAVLRRDECARLLADERGQQERPELAVVSPSQRPSVSPPTRTWSAPMARTRSTLAVLHTPVTSAPNDLAIWQPPVAPSLGHRSDGVQDLARPGDAAPPRRRHPADTYPHLFEFTSQHILRASYDFGDEYEFGLDLILDGLDAFDGLERESGAT